MTRVVFKFAHRAFMMILDKSNISVSTKNSLFMERISVVKIKVKYYRNWTVVRSNS